MAQPTAYEIAVIGTDGIARLASYSERRTRRVLCTVFDRRRGEILPLIDGGAAQWERDQMAFIARIGFTGRTRRDALAEGELPRLGAAPCGAP